MELDLKDYAKVASDEESVFKRNLDPSFSFAGVFGIN